MQFPSITIVFHTVTTFDSISHLSHLGTHQLGCWCLCGYGLVVAAWSVGQRCLSSCSPGASWLLAVAEEAPQLLITRYYPDECSGGSPFIFDSWSQLSQSCLCSGCIACFCFSLRSFPVVLHLNLILTKQDLRFCQCLVSPLYFHLKNLNSKKHVFVCFGSGL